MTSYRLNLKVPFQLDLRAALDETENRTNINQKFNKKMFKPGIFFTLSIIPCKSPIYYHPPTESQR